MAGRSHEPRRPPTAAGQTADGACGPPGTFASYRDYFLTIPDAVRLAETRGGAAYPLTVLRARSARPVSTPPTPDLNVQFVTDGWVRCRVDMGFDRFNIDAPGQWLVAVGGQAVEIDGAGEFGLLSLAFPWRRVVSVMGYTVPGPVPDFGPLHAQPNADPVVGRLVRAAWDELGRPHPDNLRVQALTLGVIGRLMALARRPVAAGPRAARLGGPRLRRVLAFLEDRLAEPITLADLAAEAHLSEFHFARLFKAAVGLPPHQFVIRRRVERAKRLIREGRVPLAHVAADTGFASQSHLNRHFKRLVGCTPAEFRD